MADLMDDKSEKRSPNLQNRRQILVESKSCCCGILGEVDPDFITFWIYGDYLRTIYLNGIKINFTHVIQSAKSVNAKCNSLVYYKVRKVLLQSATAILLQNVTSVITKWVRCYKVRQTLEKTPAVPGLLGQTGS